MRTSLLAFKALVIRCRLSLLILLSLSAFFYQTTLVALNVSESLPQKAFLILKGITPQRFEYVAFNHPWFKSPLIKEVIGVKGDEIKETPEGIWVGEHFIGALRPLSQEGRRLDPIKPQTIPHGYVFVRGSHPRSFDSRYQQVGLIPLSNVVGRAIALW